VFDKDQTMPSTTTKRLSEKPRNTLKSNKTKSTRTKRRSRAEAPANGPSHGQELGKELGRLRPALTRAGVKLIQGDSRLEMAKMPENSIDVIVTDPPYGLTDGFDVNELLAHWSAGSEYKGTKRGFMGKDWDSCVPSPALWREALRVLKPGGHCLAFAGARTADLTGMSLRMAGFETRDMLSWNYASGMPKSRSIGHALGHEFDTAVGSALAPSHEPIIVARKPLGRGLSIAANALQWDGAGGINIDAARIGSVQTSKTGPAGRWPKNALFSHAPDCRCLGVEEVACSAHSPAQKMSGFGKFGGGKVIVAGDDYHPGHEQVERWECSPSCPVAILDAQQATRPARYFQTFAPEPGDVEELPIERIIAYEKPAFHFAPKPSKEEREAGLSGGGFQARRGHRLSYGKRKDVAVERLNVHTTVKPIAVMRWLIDLACPEGGTVLDPFNGSGSTGCAAVLSSRPYVGIELDDTEGYLDITAARISYWAEKAKEEHAGTGKVVRLPSPSERAGAKKAGAKKAA
jgi:DNA modification methylase